MKREYEAGTEGLRGFAALMVLYTHLLWPANHVDPGYVPSHLFPKFEAGQGAVLLFFVLSGYVIGLTNPVQFSKSALTSYLCRRWIRLVPLYFLAIGLSVLVRPIDNWKTVLGNLFFLQNDLPYFGWHMPVLASNSNIWSLNYEVVYYLVFPLIWLTPKLFKIWIVCAVLLSVGGWGIPGIGPVLASYSTGWTFWLAGCWLAKARQTELDSRENRLPWPSLLLLWLATWHIKPMWWFAHRFGLLPSVNVWVNYSFFDFIPACICLMMVATGRRPGRWMAICWLTLVLPLAFMVWQLVRGQVSTTNWTIDQLFCVMALLAWKWRPSARLIQKLAVVGGISYAIYIFQRPVQWFILDAPWLPRNTSFTFALRCLVIVFLTVSLSWLLERKLQPWLRNTLLPKQNVE